jgi:ABC-type transport system involved in Fe-S cluster assembly fused permease/ATPase subunit
VPKQRGLRNLLSYANIPLGIYKLLLGDRRKQLQSRRTGPLSRKSDIGTKGIYLKMEINIIFNDAN